MASHRYLLITLGVLLLTASAWADNSHRIYGKVTTEDGDVYEGLIRWDKNEASWVDMLDGNKELDPDNFEGEKLSRKRESKIRIFGLTVGETSGSWNPSSAQTGIRFGHLRRLEPLDDDMALLILKSGQKVEMENSSTDLGEGIREIIIEDVDEGEVELVWRDIESIEFADTDGGMESNFGERLYGTLTTRRGETFSGFVGWDVDEVFGRDVLDGEEDEDSRKIRFDKIAAIERYSSSGATVHLKSGDKIVLRGTNDVDDDNRGIIIADPAFGQVVVDWDEFDRLDFSTPDGKVRYANFDGGRPIEGTVFTEDGEKYTGRIRWDNDEEYTWEILDGDSRDTQYDIEFGAIKKIEKRSHSSSIVTLRDGREFRLRGSNDVDGDNKGIIVLDGAKKVVEIDWDDFASVEFK